LRDKHWGFNHILHRIWRGGYIVGEIKAGLEGFKSAALQFSNAAVRTTSIQQVLQNSSDALLETWKGKGKDAFNNEYQIIRKNMFTYSEILKDISKELLDIGTKFETEDTDIRNQLLNSGSR